MVKNLTTCITPILRNIGWLPVKVYMFPYVQPQQNKEVFDIELLGYGMVWTMF